MSSAGTTPEFMGGTLDRGEPLVTFSSLVLAPDSGPAPARTPAHSVALSVLDHDHFTLVPLDRAWRTLFTRQP